MAEKRIEQPAPHASAYGLSTRQLSAVRQAAGKCKVELTEADCLTDVIAGGSFVSFIAADAVSEKDREFLFGYYEEISCSCDETVIWIGGRPAPSGISKSVKSFGRFEDVEPQLTLILSEAKKRSKNSRDFSMRIANCLRILFAIRANPGVSTKRLGEDLGISDRTVQRCISTLRMAGEGILYDGSKKGWMLDGGISFLALDACFDVEILEARKGVSRNG